MKPRFYEVFMKIIKGFDRAVYLADIKSRANENCDVCPNCKERPTFGAGLCKRYCKGIFKIRHYKIDVYFCDRCNTEWESEPYEWV